MDHNNELALMTTSVKHVGLDVHQSTTLAAVRKRQRARDRPDDPAHGVSASPRVLPRDARHDSRGAGGEHPGPKALRPPRAGCGPGHRLRSRLGSPANRAVLRSRAHRTDPGHDANAQAATKALSGPSNDTTQPNVSSNMLGLAALIKCGSQVSGVAQRAGVQRAPERRRSPSDKLVCGNALLGGAHARRSGRSLAAEPIKAWLDLPQQRGQRRHIVRLLINNFPLR